jgi:Ran GTPase-activating protein 1
MTSSSPTTEQHIFSLANQSLKLDSADDITPHLAPLLDSDTVREIHLGGNTLGAPACAHLATVLRQKKTLRVADFADIFTSRLLAEVPPALSSLLTSLLPLQNLQTLDLSDNAFGLNTQAPLVKFLEQHVPLRHLILSNNGLGPRAGVLIADALTALAARKDEARKAVAHGDGVAEIPYLETVVCGRNRLESGSMAAWARMFRAHDRVATVRLVQNGIRPEGVAVLLRDGLGACQALHVLDLQDNTFTAVGAQALAEVVGGWKSLRELGVGDSLLGSKGWGMVMDALGKGTNRELKIVRAQYDEVDSHGVRHLLDVIQDGKLPALRRVELNGNKFSEIDPGILGLRKVFEGRREEEAGTEHDNDDADDDDDEWGLDDLSDLEDDDDEDEDEDDDEEDEEKKGVEEEEEETELKAEAILKEIEAEKESEVPERKDEDVDDLAEKLSKTGI